MPFEIIVKKTGMNIVRAYLHSAEIILPAFPKAAQKRAAVGYKMKKYQDGRIVDFRQIETLEEAFPCKGDKK